MNQTVREIYRKYKDYEYRDVDFSNYGIKSPKDLDATHGGICWDFVVAISAALDEHEINHTCYFSEVQRNNQTLVTHTYIITDEGLWIECSWQKHKSINESTAWNDVEKLLLNEYDGDEIHTVAYEPKETIGKTHVEFFAYLNHFGKELS